jgi:hypothetical protein
MKQDHIPPQIELLFAIKIFRDKGNSNVTYDGIYRLICELFKNGYKFNGEFGFDEWLIKDWLFHLWESRMIECRPLYKRCRNDDNEPITILLHGNVFQKKMRLNNPEYAEVYDQILAFADSIGV